MEYCYKDGIIYEVSACGSKIIGNIKDGVIRDGEFFGCGNALGNAEDGIIKDGYLLCNGNMLGNVSDDIIRDGLYLGCGNEIGKVSDYIIQGMENNPTEMVACWHFLIGKIF